MGLYDTGCGAALMRQTYGFSHRAAHGMNPLLGLLFSLIAIFRDVAQLVARTAGGGEAAGSSPVIPTKRKENL